MGERQFYRERQEEAMAWIAGHEDGVCRVWPSRRWGRFWVPRSQYWWHRAGLGAVLILAAAGWIVGGRTAAALLLAPLAYSLVALLVHTSIRYSHPTWWALCLSAGVAVKWARDKLISSP